MSLEMLKKYSSDIFVETGSKSGGTAVRAVTLCGFKEAHTIEIDKVRYDQCVRAVRKYRNIHLYFGDSAIWFPKIMEKITGPCTIWLDAHPMIDYLDFKNTPLLQNVLVLQQMKANGKLPTNFRVLMDDLRCYSKEDRDKIEEVSRSIGRVSFENNTGGQLNDILVIT